MANVTYTVPNKNGSYDGDMVLKQYTSMTINSGDTVTVDQPCRGLFIYVQGDCTINGTLTMTARGAFANPTSSGGSDSNAVDANGLRLPFITSSGTDILTSSATLFNGCGTAVRTAIANHPSISSNGTILEIERTNTSIDQFTGQQRDGSSYKGTPTQKSSVSNSTGTGGRGGYWMNDAGCNGYVYVSGGYSSCFGGGSGGGGWNGNGYSCGAGDATQATNYGGQGGTGASNHGYAGMGGGAGNPRGGGVGTTTDAQHGTGGVIWLIVGGNLTIGSGGVISANGSNGGSSSGGDFNSAGGGSGGGRIIIAHKGTYTNNGTVQANGGYGGGASNGFSEDGQRGMHGTITTLQVA